ncbi:MAG: hypothetical protein R3B99_27525 [Polyangiales bacterium]
MSDLATDRPSTPSVTGLPTLYRHPARKKWGVGLVLERLADRAHVQFQDGRLRTIHVDYLRKLEPVDRPYDVARGLVDALESMAPDDLRNRGRRRSEPITIDEQLAYLVVEFPKVFADPGWVEEHRGDGRKRPLKRHRDALIARARRELAEDALKATREKGADAVVDLLGKLAKSTSLVGTKEAGAFASIDASHHEAVADAVVVLLHGKAPLEERFDGWVRALEAALGDVPSWPLATLFLGTFEPDRHAVVHPSAFEQQARYMAPGLRCGDRPMGVLYERLRTMARETFERLSERGLVPRDLIDVHDFMWATLKPAARAEIEADRARATSAAKAPVADSEAA